jgi:hypothetical protein
MNITSQTFKAFGFVLNYDATMWSSRNGSLEREKAHDLLEREFHSMDHLVTY